MPQGCLFAALLLALLAPTAGQAEIFKCVAENGEVTFSQTPCPKEESKKIKDSVESTEMDKKPVHSAEDEPADGGETEALYASTTTQSSQVQDNQSTKGQNAALSAQKQQAEARAAEQRLQCEGNIKAQINNINSQMQSGFSSSLAESLAIKRRALENRLDDC
ncbi:MAG: DUF4124 domain-containing protein [Gammaproteobacteria bacterium]|nr:DUF4124 domain-containing protein [Gammaproteobacteria bacterium]